MTTDEIATAAGSSVEEVERFRLLVGLPTHDILMPGLTVYSLESYRVAASLMGEASAHEFVRLLAASTANVAAAATAITLNDVTPRLHEMDLPLVDVLELVDAMVTEMITRTPKAWQGLFREHLLLSAAHEHAEHEAELLGLRSRSSISLIRSVGRTRVSHPARGCAFEV